MGKISAWVSDPLKNSYLPEGNSANPNKRDIKLTAWKNDHAYAKIDVLCNEDVAQVCVGYKSNTDISDKIIINRSFIKTCFAHDIEKDVPDILFTSGPVDMQSGKLYSVWIDVEATKQAAAGEYKIVLFIKAGDETIEFNLELEILDITLPENTTYLELWQYPYSSNRYYSGKAIGELFPEGMKSIYNTHLDEKYDAQLLSQIELYKKAGGNCVTVTITEDPWNWQTPDPYPSMVKWTKETDRTFSFDYTDFDKWVALNEKGGINGPILSFSIVNWGNNITYYDKLTGGIVTESHPIGSPEWVEIWTSFFKDYMAHTMQTGVFDRVYISMDERPYELVKEAVSVIESVKNDKGESFKISLAVFSFDCEPLFDHLHTLSFSYHLDCEKMAAVAKRRNELGLVTTLYTCGPNGSSLHNEPYQGLDTMWYIARLGCNGFLRWALDAFNVDPLETSAHRLYAAGDIFLIYPTQKNSEVIETKSSVRFEILAQGCRDITKFNYIRSEHPELAGKVQAILDTIVMKNNGDTRHAAIKKGIEDFNSLVREITCK